MDQLVPGESPEDARLTGIHNPYTLASTPEPGSEIDNMMIDDFLTTLADVALSVASRSLRLKDEGGS